MGTHKILADVHAPSIGSDGVAKSYTWTLPNTSSNNQHWYKIARVTGSQSQRFKLQMVGGYSYSDNHFASEVNVYGQLNNDNNYDLVFYQLEKSGQTSSPVLGFGQVDVDDVSTDLYVKLANFAELAITASVSKGDIYPEATSTSSASEPTNLVAATEQFSVLSEAHFAGEVNAASLDISGNADIDGTLNADGLDVDGNADISGNITSAGWTGDVIASAYLDADTAHLSTTQTFTGAKTFTDTVALTGTGRITGIDTVSADTDAASKTYVDSAVSSAGGGDVTLSGTQTFTGVKTFGTTTKLQFRDSAAYINSPTANDIEVAATTITLDASSDIQLEGNTTVTGSITADQINLQDGGDYITFYGNDAGQHSISSRDASGTAGQDDLRINSYAAVHINLDSNSNNTSNADFTIGHHGDNDGAITQLFTVDGENGNVTLTGIVLDGNTITGINDSGEFDDDDAHIMTSAGVLDKIQSEISNLVDSSPSALNTLNELAAAINDDASFSTTITNSIATKMPLAGGTFTGAITMGGDTNMNGHSIYESSENYYSIDLKDHSDYTWLRNVPGVWTFQQGTGGDSWTNSFQLTLPSPGSTANAVFAELGQKTSNAADGRYKGVRIVKYASSALADGDLQAANATFTGDVSLAGGALSISGDGSNAVTFTESGAGLMTIAAADDIILDAGSDIVLDAAGNDVWIKTGGTTVGTINMASSNLTISSAVSDKDIIFKGNDGGSTITALTLDMSAGGTANFNNHINLNDNNNLLWGGNAILQHTGSATNIGDNGSASALVLSGGNQATFAGEVQAASLDINGNADISGNLSGVDTLTATTFVGALTGNASTATVADQATNLNAIDDRDMAPEDRSYSDDFRIFFTSKEGLEDGTSTGSNWQDALFISSYSDSSGGNPNVLAFDKSEKKIYHYQASATASNWGTAKQLAYTDSDISGNAATATTLATARNIGGVSFNGSAAINLPGVNTGGNQDTSGNAATATKIASITNSNIVQLSTTTTQTGTKTFSGVIDITNTTDSTNATGDTGALRCEGGGSIAKKLYVGSTITGSADVIAFSDRKLKDNIETLDGKKVLDMRGVSFTRKDTGAESSGVIAQEIQKVAPELVHDTEGTLGVAYGNLVGYLIEAIKDQQKQIDELKAMCSGCSK